MMDWVEVLQSLAIDLVAAAVFAGLIWLIVERREETKRRKVTFATSRRFLSSLDEFVRDMTQRTSEDVFDLLKPKKFPKPPKAWTAEQRQSVKSLLKEYADTFYRNPKTRTKMLWKLVLENDSLPLVWQLATIEDASRMAKHFSVITELENSSRRIDDFQPWLPPEIVEELSNLEHAISTYRQSLERWSNRSGTKEIEATTKVVSVDQWEICKGVEEIYRTILDMGIEPPTITLDERIHEAIVGHILGRERAMSTQKKGE